MLQICANLIDRLRFTRRRKEKQRVGETSSVESRSSLKFDDLLINLFLKVK